MSQGNNASDNIHRTVHQEDTRDGSNPPVTTSASSQPAGVRSGRIRRQATFRAVGMLHRFLPGGTSDARERRRESRTTDDQDASWLSRLCQKFSSLELENKGSVARDHLALERTFLAWLRTSLSFASIGVAVTQLFRLNTTIRDPNSPADNGKDINRERIMRVGKPLGGTFIGIAILVLLIGFRRYFEGQYWIVRGKFPASRGSVTIVAFAAGALIVASLSVILAVSRGVLLS